MSPRKISASCRWIFDSLGFTLVYRMLAQAVRLAGAASLFVGIAARALLYFRPLKPNSDPLTEQSSDALSFECENGVALRAAMGVMLLGLPRRQQAWDILRRRTAQYKFICTPYAKAVVGWMNPPPSQ
jgi:hypothetical protein